MGTIISHLDYCNSIYIGLSETDLKKLQRVQNITAKIVLGKGKFADPTNCLRTLPWLPIKYGVEYKILCMVYKCLLGMPLIILRICSMSIPPLGKVYDVNNHTKDL